MPYAMSDPLLRSKHAARCPDAFLTLYSVHASKAGAFAFSPSALESETSGRTRPRGRLPLAKIQAR
eukprot:925154-Pyramimonas_sp.AAC.1